jgi:hypothetical protein
MPMDEATITDMNNKAPPPPSAVSQIDKRMLREMERQDLTAVKMRLNAALQKQNERVPVVSPDQRPVQGESPTVGQVMAWVSLKESERERKAGRFQIWTLVFAAIAAGAAVISLLIQAASSLLKTVGN